MRENGFLMETVVVEGGKKEQRIRVYVVDDVEYVAFVKNGHIIPIPYDCLVCFVGNNLDDSEDVPENILHLEAALAGLETS